MSPKGRGSNKARSQAPRGRGTQGGGLKHRGKVSPIVRAGLISDADLRSGVLDETATFFDRMRAKIRRRAR